MTMTDCRHLAWQMAGLMVGLTPAEKAELLEFLREKMAAVEAMTPDQRFADAEARLRSVADQEEFVEQQVGRLLRDTHADVLQHPRSS